MRTIRALELWMVLAVAVAPQVARPSVSVTPTTSYDGSYVVRWTDYSGGTTWRAYLLESYNGGAWTRTAVTGSYSRSFTGRALGTYSYLVEIWEYDPELRREYFDHETNVATVTVVPLAPPWTPQALTGPATSATGSYTISWSAPAGPPVTRYELFENGVLVYADAARSAAISGKTNGAYSYVVRGCNAAGCGPGTAPLAVTVLFVPGAPGPITGPSSSATGSYALSWGAASGSVARYELLENGVVASSGTALTAALSGRSSGTYSYVARACNASGCGTGTAAFPVTVLLPPGAPGCAAVHETCGVPTPGTRSGNWVPDHQPPNAINPPGGAQRLYPQCIDCSREQGLDIARRRQQGQ